MIRFVEFWGLTDRGRRYYGRVILEGGRFRVQGSGWQVGQVSTGLENQRSEGRSRSELADKKGWVVVFEDSTTLYLRF